MIYDQGWVYELRLFCNNSAIPEPLLYVGWKQPVLFIILSLDLAATISRRCPPFTETIFAFLAEGQKLFLVVLCCRFNTEGITLWIGWPWRNQSSCCDFVTKVFFGKDEDVSLWYHSCDLIPWNKNEKLKNWLLLWCGLTFWRWSAYRNQQLRTGRSTPAK